jgi:valyl-tRNA synthetase
MLEKIYDPREVDAKWSGIWSESGIFVADADSERIPYTIILPPPNITGKLTIGHALGSTVQDLLVRWKRMRGYNVLWLPGTDHAGIATQKVVERALEERGITKEELGREGFIDECFRWKDEYHRSIIEQLESLGSSLDWTREAFTLDENVSRAVREVFVRLFRKGYIYRSRYIVNWCPSCGTAISDEEVVFKERQGKLYYIAYPFVDGEGEVVVGTTRPETMLGDVAVAVNPHDERSRVLEGRFLRLPLTDRTIPVIFDDVVDPSFGTGCLKVTPAHDATDFDIGQRHELEPVTVIGWDGMMNETAGGYTGLGIMEARERILEDLRAQGLLRKIEDYQHAIGYHDRCDEMIEPAISRQWFLRMKELSDPAVRVVREGEVVFLPERWKNIYLSWMENIRDWCISRQLWWGHRIPVWYCGACEEMLVAVEEPIACTKCGSKELTQDEDVLDTWFSSWLWTFSPMGWPEQTKDLAVFHPTNVLVTGGDIIFFWVARMIMASLEFVGEIPFSTVYITGIVRDMKGLKMSKSLGNSPDMIDVIRRNGADAFRFSLMMLSPPGQDLLFDEQKVEVGRHFANKIWNAARFVLGQDMDEGSGAGGDRDEEPIHELFAALFGDVPHGVTEFGWEERWITSRLSKRYEEMERALETFRFDEAARIVYDFFWHEFCDWYLELSKPAFREGGARGRGTATAARAVLGTSLVMLHPFMPFITEEIWSMLATDPCILSGFAFRGIPVTLAQPELEDHVARFREIVTNIRNLRQTFGIDLGREVDVVISCETGGDIAKNLELFRDQFRILAKIGDLKIGEGLPKPIASAAAGLASLEIYVPLGGIIDIDEETRRLQKVVEKLAGDRDKIETRLRDQRFLDKAPPDVVERERERFREMDDRMHRIRTILEDLG